MLVEVFWSLWLSERLVSSALSARLFSGPPGGRPRAHLKAGTPRKAPTPAPTTKTCPHNSESAQHEGRRNVESTNLQINGVEEKLRRPRNPA